MAKLNLVSPDYLICCDCESPIYTFEWKDGAPKDVLCEVCGNEEDEMFLTEEQFEAYAHSDKWHYSGR